MEAIEVRKEIVANSGGVTLEEELEIILRDNKNLQRDIDAGKRAERYLKSNKKRMAEIMAKLMEE